MSLYAVVGTVAGEEIARSVEANHGADALHMIVAPFLPMFSPPVPANRKAWYEKNVRLDVYQIEADSQPKPKKKKRKQ